jgi:hypothetical protein
VRLIQMKYPGLIDNLVPYDSPMEVTADIARRESMEHTGLASKDIGIFFISPCPAKRTAVTNPIVHSTTNVDGVISFAEVYPLILAKLEKLDPQTVEAFRKRELANPDGVRWGFTGGESIGLRIDKYLAVDGIHNVIAILEEIENERLRDIEFIEANSCTGGCIGGPLTVANRYSAKSRYSGYVRAAEQLAAAAPSQVYEPADTHLETWAESPAPRSAGCCTSCWRPSWTERWRTPTERCARNSGGASWRTSSERRGRSLPQAHWSIRFDGSAHRVTGNQIIFDAWHFAGRHHSAHN